MQHIIGGSTDLVPSSTLKERISTVTYIVQRSSKVMSFPLMTRGSVVQGFVMLHFPPFPLLSRRSGGILLHILLPQPILICLHSLRIESYTLPLFFLNFSPTKMAGCLYMDAKCSVVICSKAC